MCPELICLTILCVPQTEAPEEEGSSLQARLPVLTRKMRKMCVQLVKKNPVPELAEDLDIFTGTNPPPPHKHPWNGWWSPKALL